MFGTEVRVRRPILLLLVFGAFVALVGITASAQSSMVTSNVTDLVVKSVVDGDATTIRKFASNLTQADLTGATPVTTGRRAELDQALAPVLAAEGILEIQVHRADGSLVSGVTVSPTGIGPGADVGPSPATVEGQAEAVLVPLDQAGVASDLGPATLLRERLPIRDPDGQVLGGRERLARWLARSWLDSTRCGSRSSSSP